MTTTILNTKIFFVFLLISLVFLCQRITYIIFPFLQSGYGMLKDTATIFCIALTLAFYLFNKINDKFLRFHTTLFFLYYFFLVGESIIKYDKILIYPHIILGLSSFFFLVTFYVVMTKFVDPAFFLKILCYATCGFIYLQQFLVRTSIVPPGSDIDLYGLNRSSHATTIFLLVLCTIYFLSLFLKKPKFSTSAIIILNLIIIIIENHRSVWTSFIAAILVFSFLVLKGKRSKIKWLFFYFLIAMVLFTSIYFTLFGESKHVRYINFMQERFQEIYMFRELGGTATHRLNQYEYYLPLVWKDPLFGLRFRGFEIPLPPGFSYQKMSGHHFHSGYLDVLFYHGFFGLFLLFCPIVYFVIKFCKEEKHNIENMTLFAFICSGFVFSLVYIPSFYYFAVLGIGLAFLEKREKEIHFT